jgi:hypothetical protein
MLPRRIVRKLDVAPADYLARHLRPGRPATGSSLSDPAESSAALTPVRIFQVADQTVLPVGGPAGRINAARSAVDSSPDCPPF